MKKTNLKKIVFGATSVIVIGSIISGLTYANKIETSNSKILLNEELKFSTNTSKLGLNSSAQLQAETPPSTPTEPTPMTPSVKSLEDIKKDYETAVIAFITSATEQNFSAFENAKVALDNAQQGDKDTRTEDQKKSYNDFNALFVQFKNFAFDFNSYKNNLNLELLSKIETSASVVTQAATLPAESKASEFEKSSSASIVKKVDSILKSAKFINSFHNYIFDLSSNNKTEFEKLFEEFSKLPEATIVNSEEMKLLDLIKLSKTFADSIFALNSKMSDFSSTVEFKDLDFEKELEDALKAFTTFSTNNTVSENSLGKLISIQLEISVKTIDAKFKINKALLQYAFSVTEARKTEYENTLSSQKTILKNLIKQQATLKSIPESEISKFESTIDNNLFLTNDAAYTKSIQQIIATNALYQQYSENPSKELKRQIEISSEKVELFRNWALTIDQEINKLKNPSATIAKPFSQFVDEFNKKLPSEETFGKNTLAEYEVFLNNIKTNYEMLNKVEETMSTETPSTTNLNWDLELKNQTKYAFNDLNLGYNKLLLSTSKIVVWKNAIYSLKIDTLTELNIYLTNQKNGFDKVSESGEVINKNGDKIKSLNYIIELNTRLLIQNSAIIQSLTAIPNKTEAQDQQLKQAQTKQIEINKILNDSKTELAKLKEDQKLENSKLEAAIAALDQIQDAKLIETNKKLQDKAVEIVPEFNGFINFSDNSDDDLTIENLRLIDQFKKQKNYYMAYYTSPYNWATDQFDFSREINTNFQLLGQRLTRTFAKSSLDIITPIFTKFGREWNIYRAFLDAVNNPTEASVATSLNDFIGRNTTNVNYINLASSFFNFWVVKDDLNLNIDTTQYKEAKQKFEALLKASNEILANHDQNLSIALIIIKNIITEIIVKATEAKIQIIEALNSFLNNTTYFKPYLKEATTRNQELLNPTPDVQKLNFVNTYLTDFKNLVSAVELVTNSANNALGDELFKALQNSINDPESFSLMNSVDLGTKLLASGSANPWTTILLNRMLMILNSLDKNRSVNILIKSLNLAFENNLSAATGFASDPAFFLKQIRQQIIDVKNAKLNTFSKAINEIGPEIKELLDENVKIFLEIRQMFPDPSTMTPDAMRQFQVVSFRLQNVLPLLAQQQGFINTNRNIKAAIDNAKMTLSNFQKTIIATLSADDQTIYNSALERSAEFEKNLKDVIERRRINDQEFEVLHQKLRNYLTQTEIESVKIINAPDTSVSELRTSQNAFNTALRNINDFVSSSLIQALNTEQLANLNNLKRQITNLQNEVSNSNRKLNSNNDQITDMFTTIINTAFTPAEAFEYNKVASELLRIKTNISTKTTNVLRLTELLESLKLIPTNKLTSEQKENLIIFEFELNREQNDLKPLNIELTRLNSKITEFNTKISLKLPEEQKKTYDSLILENSNIVKDLETKTKNIDEIKKQIKDLEQIVINLLIRQEANSIRYTGLWQTLTNAKIRLIEAKAKFNLNSEIKWQLSLLLNIAFTPDEFRKYFSSQDTTNMLIANMNEALRNVNQNRSALDELNKIINDRISKLTDVNQKASLESSQRIIAEQDTFSEQLNNMILSLQVKIDEEFIKSYAQLSKRVLPQIMDFLKNLNEELKTATDADTIQAINDDIKATEEQIKTETENLELLESYLPKIVALEPIVKLVIDQYNLDIKAINSSINNVNSQSLIGTQFNIKDSAISALNAQIESINKSSNPFKWTTDQLKKYTSLVNVFQNKNLSDKAFEQFKNQPNSENQKMYDDAFATLLKSITHFENLNFKPASLQLVLDKITMFKNDSETKQNLKTSTKNYFSNPSSVNRLLWINSISSLAIKLKEATDKLNAANALADTNANKNAMVQNATHHLNIIKQIDEESKQYLRFQNIVSAILDINTKFDTLNAEQINNGIAQVQMQLNSFMYESPNHSLFEANSWILKSIQDIRTKLTNRELNTRVNMLGRTFIDTTNLKTFTDFYEVYIQTQNQNMITNDFTSLAPQIKLIEDTIVIYQRSTFTNIDTVNSAIKKVYETKQTLVAYLMANQSMPTIQNNFIVKTNTLFDQFLDLLNNVLNTWQSANQALNNSLTLYANNPTTLTLNMLLLSANDAQLSRVLLPSVDQIIVLSTQMFNLENTANQISANPVLNSSIPELLSRVEQLKKLISDEVEFRFASGSIKQAIDTLNSRINILELNAQILSGGANYRELNRQINTQIDNLEKEPIATIETLDKIQSQIFSLQPSNPQQTLAKQALTKKLIKAKNELSARDLIKALNGFATLDQINAIAAFTNNSLNIYTPLLNALRRVRTNQDIYTKLMTTKDATQFLETQKTLKNDLILDTLNAQSLKSLSIQSATTIADLIISNQNRKLANIQISSELLNGINNGNDQLIKNSKQRFEQNQQILSSGQQQEYTTLFNLLTNWQQIVSLATNGSVSNRNTINNISNEISKLEQLPEVLRESIDNKTKELGLTTTSQLAFIIIISTVFGVTALFSALFLILKKTFKKNKQPK